jgi:hypothetical protein
MHRTIGFVRGVCGDLMDSFAFLRDVKAEYVQIDVTPIFVAKI